MVGVLETRRRRGAAALAAVALAIIALLAGGVPAAEQQVSWSATADRTDVRAGETVLVTVTARLAEGWHLYSTTTPPNGPKPTRFALDEGGPAAPAGVVYQPKPESKFDENFGMQTEQYGGTVAFALPVRIAENAAGPTRLAGSISYMVCDPSRCVPGSATFEVMLDVADGPARSEFASVRAPAGLLAGPELVVAPPKAPKAQATGAQPAPAASEPVRSAPADDGLFAYVLLAIAAGFASLLTPCVFPMIPITVSYFTKNSGQSRARGVADAAVYAVAIIATFTVLGILVAAVFGATGVQQFAANPWVNILLAVIFVVLALNLFGFFEIVVPGSVLTSLDRLSGRGGMLGTVLMAFTFTLTSFTCTMPFISTVLVSSSQGEWLRPLVGMLGYASAFALPFFLLALFPQALLAMPKAGGWMISIKVVMGFLELAAAMKFISNVDLVLGFQQITRELFLSVWVAIAFVTAMYLLGKVRLPHERAVEAIGAVRMLASTLFLALGFYLFTGLYGGRLGELEAFLPPISSMQGSGAIGGATTASGELEWLTDYDKALAESKATGKPIMIDFTGYACTNCRWMEKNVFPTPEVRRELERFVRVQLFTDGQGEEYDRNREMQEARFGTVALPLYVVLDGRTERELARHEGLTRDPSEFASFLRDATGTSVARR